MYLWNWIIDDYLKSIIKISVNEEIDRRSLLAKLIHMHYTENDQEVLDRILSYES